MESPAIMCVMVLTIILSAHAEHHGIQDSSGELWVEPAEQKVMEGGVATLLCHTPLATTPPLYWRRNGHRLDNRDNTQQIFRTWSGSALRLEPVRATLDDARYECILDDGRTEPLVASALLRVYPHSFKPEGFPHVEERPVLRVVEEEERCQLTCTAHGNPTPSISWLKDYTPLDLDVFRYNVTEHGDLHINYVAGSDEGTYECVARNALGVAYSQPARLIVEEYSWP